MTAFDDRERAFEAKFAHDEEVVFRTEARAIRATALWAAGLMGRSADEAQAYVLEVLHSDVQHAAHADALARLEADVGALLAPGAVRAAFATHLRAEKDLALAEA
jgi:hypothetical protein